MVQFQPRAGNLETYILTTVDSPNKCLSYIFHRKAQKAIILHCNPMKTSDKKPYLPPYYVHSTLVCSIGIPHFIALCFISFCRYCISYKLNVRLSFHQQKDYVLPKAQMMVNIFSQQSFKIKVCTLFCQTCYRTFNRLQYSVNIIFISTRKPKKLRESLYCDLYFITVGGLELNPPYL